MNGNITTALGSVYGPDVVGKEQFEAEQVAAEKGYNLYGPDVVDDHPANAGPRSPGSPPSPEPAKRTAPKAPSPASKAEAHNAPPGPAVPTEGDMATLPMLELFLRENPGSHDLAMAQEFQRPKPRRGAIEMFLAAERAREAGARDEIIAVLDAKYAQE
jgi:hypothetical protein